MKENLIRIAAFTGSLRKGSYNMASLRAASGLMPEGSVLEILDVSRLPFLNEDEEAAGIPESVQAFKQALAAADGILIATPEYNYSIPPVLKNALDWASRGDVLPLVGKPTAILSASPGLFGGARAQYQLRQVCVALNMPALTRPEVMIGSAHTKFNEQGILEDEGTGRRIRALLEALASEVRKASI